VKLFLRTFANCEDQEATQAITARISLALSSFSPRLSAEPKRYWKIPNYFEFASRLRPQRSFRSRQSFRLRLAGGSTREAGSTYHRFGIEEMTMSFWFPR